MKTENRVRLVGKLKEEPFCFEWGGVSLRVVVPSGLTSEDTKKETTMSVMAADETGGPASECREGDMVKVEGFLSHYQNKKTGNWQTQIKATLVDRLTDEATASEPAGEPEADDLPF